MPSAAKKGGGSMPETENEIHRTRARDGGGGQADRLIHISQNPLDGRIHRRLGRHSFVCMIRASALETRACSRAGHRGRTRRSSGARHPSRLRSHSPGWWRPPSGSGSRPVQERQAVAAGPATAANAGWKWNASAHAARGNVFLPCALNIAYVSRLFSDTILPRFRFFASVRKRFERKPFRWTCRSSTERTPNL